MDSSMAAMELVTSSGVKPEMTSLNLVRPVSAAPGMERIEEHPSWELLAKLTVTIRAAVALNQFTVRDLLAMKEGQVFESLASDGDEVPLKVGNVFVGWSEFELVEQRIAVRLTRLV